MSRKFLTHIDLAKNELQNAVIQNVARPSSPSKGQIYLDSTDSTLYWYDGTAWVSARGGGTGFPGFGPVTQEQTFGSVKNDGVATTTARADHTHGNPVHDAAAHNSIPLSALGVPTASVNLNGQTITNLGPPVNGTDASNKTYVDNLMAGLSWKDTVRASTASNITLSGTTTIDGNVALQVGDRVLMRGMTVPAQNGIYIVQAGAWTRATDADSEAELLNAAVFVSEGVSYADTAWVCTTNAPITVGTTNLTWVQFAGGGAVTAGAGLTQTGNTLDVGAGTGISVTADQVAIGDPELLALAGVTSAADQVPYFNGVGTATTTPLTSFGRDLIDSADSGAARLSLGVAAWSRQYIAGAGLVGGGDMTADRTFDVGAGTGITVAADAVALDTAYTDARYALKASGVGRFAMNVGAATSQVVNHALNTRDVQVQVYRVAAPYDTVDCDVERTDVNNVTVRFSTAPAANEYRVLVLA
jgi:hypothetical protein